jgi:hypothetical protein
MSAPSKSVTFDYFLCSTWSNSAIVTMEPTYNIAAINLEELDV